MRLLANAKAEYSLLAKLFHWLSAVMALGLFALGLWMVDLTYYHDWYQRAPELHISIGVCLALLTILRVLYRSIYSYPAPLPAGRVQMLASKLVHIGMYLLMFVVYVSGYLVVTAEGEPVPVFAVVNVPAVFTSHNNLQDTAGAVHEWATYLLMALAGVHALAALYHHFWMKDGTLSRMVTRAKV